VHHQTVIGQEAKEQMKLAGESPRRGDRVAEWLRNLPRVAL